MAFNITIDNWINELGSSPTSGKVIIQYTVYGPGIWEYIPRYTLFAEFGQNQWSQMLPDLSDPRHTRTPFRTTNRTSAVFVWNAGRQGIPIISQNQEHLFAFGLRDISCIGNRGREPGDGSIPPWIPGPPRRNPPTRVPGAPPGNRNPGNNPFVIPRRPPGPGGQPRINRDPTSIGEIVERRGVSIEYTPGVPGIPTTPTSRRRPSTTSSSVPNLSIPGDGSIRRGPITGTGVFQNGPAGPLLRNNPIDTSRIPDGSNPGYPGTRISSSDGSVEIPYGGGWLESTGDGENSNLNTSSRWESSSSPEILGQFASYGQGGNEQYINSSEAFDNQTSSGIGQLVPFSLEKGDPNPYNPISTSLQDLIGNESSANFGENSLDSTIPGINIPVLRTDDLVKLDPSPTFYRDEFGKDWLDIDVFAEPSFLSIGYPITITASCKNNHDSIPVQLSLLLCLKDPNNIWREIGRTTEDYILPDHSSSIGVTFNTNSFTATGTWIAACIAYNKEGKICDFSRSYFNVYSSFTEDGSSKELLINYSKLNEFVVPTFESNNPNTSNSPDAIIQGIHKKTLSDSRVKSSSLVHALYFSGASTKYAAITCTGSLSAIIHNTDLYDFECKLYGPTDLSSLIDSHTGSLFKINPVQDYQVKDDFLLKVPDVSQDYCFGGISYRTLANGEYYLGIRSQEGSTVGNLIIGGDSSLKTLSVISSTRQTDGDGSSTNEWNFVLALPFGLENYRIGYIGKNIDKIPYNTTWYNFKSKANGRAEVSITGEENGYIVILRLGPDNSYNTSRDKVLTYKLT